MKQLKMSRYLGLADDFHELLRWLIHQRDQREKNIVLKPTRHRSPVQNRNVRNSEEMAAIVSRRDVNLIMKAFQASWSRLGMNVGLLGFRELSFQLVGRLIDASERMGGVKRCLDSIRNGRRDRGRCLGKNGLNTLKSL